MAGTPMSSPQRPLSAIGHRDIMFWLPPGGVDNGVFAACWAELADLGVADIEPVLSRLADADVGGYIATPGGMRARDTHRLWVDSLQYHRAEDVLMSYLHDRDHRAIAEAHKAIGQRTQDGRHHRWRGVRNR